MEQFNGEVNVYLHEAAVDLWENGGSAREFGFEFDPGPLPNRILAGGETLQIGNADFKVLHTPGHTPGHITFYSQKISSAFCGDLIFFHGVGRTDLAISNAQHLMRSIKEEIFTLPDDTILYPGHGKSTTVREEKLNNPFI